MKITFKVDQINSWRNRIDVPAAVLSLEVYPSTLPQKQLELIARHLLSTDDGCNVVFDPERARQSDEVVPVGGQKGEELVEAKLPTLESLLEALEELESQAGLPVRTGAFCA